MDLFLRILIKGTYIMKIALFVLGMVLVPLPIFAGNYNIDARTEAMGGAGTATANFLSAGFYNPALVALEPSANLGVLLPVLGIQYRDPDHLVDNLEDFTAIFNSFQNAPSNPNNQINTANALRNVQNKVAYLSGGIGGAIAIPTSTVSGNFFVKGYTEGVVIPEVANADIIAIEAGTPTALQSKARILAFGILDVGLALGGNIELAGQQIAIGITPKTQKIYTYHYEVSIDNFNFDDWDMDQNRTEKSTFNVDLGAAWQRGPYRLGLVGKNLVSHDITTAFKTRSYTYSVEPLFTAGGAFVSELLTISLDIDLNNQRRFSASSGPAIIDDTQFIRFGTEFNAWGQAQLRAGYIKDMEETFDGAITFGVGLSPFNTIHIDLAAKVIDSNSYGGSAQLSFTF